MTHTPTTPFERGEKKRRKRELLFIPFLAIVFLVLTFIEIHLYSSPQRMPFEHSILFFGLVNFNILILLLLLFLIFRNVVKVFSERSGYPWGSSLKSKLIIAFGLFSIVPTGLMFLVLTSYSTSLDKWFSSGMRDVLKSSLEVIHEYFTSEKERNYKAANQIVIMWGSSSSEKVKEAELKRFLKMFSLDAIEYYPDVFGKRIVSLADDEYLPDIPEASKEFLKRGFSAQAEASTIQQYSRGTLVRVIVPVPKSKGGGAMVVSSFVPRSLSSDMEGIASTYDRIRESNFLEYPLKSIFFSLILLTTLVILFGATWFGFYLSKQLSFSLELLGRATRRISRGDYQEVQLKTGTLEVHELVKNFNRMVKNLERSQAEVLKANQDLQSTLDQLDEHSRYVQTVLSSVSTGIISLDPLGRITTLNQKAQQLLDIEGDYFEGKDFGLIIGSEKFASFEDTIAQMKKYRVPRMQKSLQIKVKEQTIPLQVTASLMSDENDEAVGIVLALDDLTLVVNAQRAEAWTEVAKRIAHEIKNPLTPIKLSAERLQKKFGAQIQDEAFANCTRLIIQQTDDLKRLVNEFSDFARLPQMRLRVSNLNDLIRDSLLLYDSAHTEVKFHVELDAELPLFSFDPDQLKRVALNLLENAIAAVKQQADPEIWIQTFYDKKTHVIRLTIGDNGPGITQTMRDRIFEPYFSTKKSGTGLGLAIVKRIVEDHRGIVRAQDRNPIGLAMTVELPFQDTEISKI